jgi:hypothetical protein
MLGKPFITHRRKRNLKLRTFALPFFFVVLLPLLAIILAPLSYPKGEAVYVVMTLRSSAPGEASLYYDLGGGFREEDKAVTQIRKDPTALVYAFAIPNRELFRFRFDPPSIFEGKLSVGDIRIMNAQGKTLREIDTLHLKPLHQIQTFQHINAEVSITVKAGADDPQVGIDLDSPFQPVGSIPMDGLFLGIIACEILLVILIYFLISYLWPRWRVHPERKTILVMFLFLYTGGLWVISEKATTTYFKVNMQSSSSGVAQLYYDDGTGYSESSSVRVNITNDKDFSNYYFRLPNKKILQFRFDPLSSAGRFVIRKMEIVSGLDISIRPLAPHQVQPAHQIRDYKLLDQDLRIATEEPADDPQLMINLQQPLDIGWIDLLLNPFFLVFVLSLLPVILLSMAGIAWGSRKKNLEWTFYLPSSKHRYIMLAVCIIISFIIISGIHRQSFSDALRYTLIAEGNIANVVYHFWEYGMQSLAVTIQNDAELAGRIRPAHWLFYNIPFALTLVRNGDLFRRDATIPVSKRINGDLQTHTLFLILCMAISCGSLSWLVWRFTHSWLPVILFPMYISLGYPLCENLIVNHSDSQEIPLLLWVSLYVISIHKTFKGQKPQILYEIFASLFLLLAYATKEISLTLFPVFSFIFGYLLLASAKEEHAFRWYCVRQWLLHTIFSTILITFVLIFRSGNHVVKNYKLEWQHLLPSIELSFKVFPSDVPWLHLVTLGFVFLAVFFILIVIRKQSASNWNSETIMILVIALGLGFGFYLLIIPWQSWMLKYYLPSVFWGSLAAVITQIFLANQLRTRGYQAVCAIWLLGSCLYLLGDFNRLNDNVQNFYAQQYGYRQSVPIISKDIAASIKPVSYKIHRVHIIGSPLFGEGALPFQRQVNLLYGMNIAVKGQPVRHVAAIERNYLGNYPGQPYVEISLSQGLPDRSDNDVIYVCQVSKEKEWSGINLEGFHVTRRWDDAPQGIRIVKYERI